MIKDIISENGLHLGITSELDSALGLHRPCSIEIKNYKLLNLGDMKTYDGKTISKKHIVEVLRTKDVTRICHLYVKITGMQVDLYKVRSFFEPFAPTVDIRQWLRYEWLYKAINKHNIRLGNVEYHCTMRDKGARCFEKQHIVDYLKEQCQDVHSNYAKRPMMGYTHLYFCSPVYGHNDYNKWRALPIKGNERFCELVVRYADKFFGPVYDSNNRYYITMNSKYVATENDIDNGGFVDADPENFGFQTREEAEKVKDELVDYAYNKACQDDEDYKRYHTREDIAAMFGIEEIDTDEL